MMSHCDKLGRSNELSQAENLLHCLARRLVFPPYDTLDSEVYHHREELWRLPHLLT